MSAMTAFMCDGPGCQELTTRPSGTQWPPQWLRLLVYVPGNGGPVRRTGAFHDLRCAEAWLTDRVDLRDIGS